MATSGTFTFSLDAHEVIEDAYELCGLELKGGYQLRTARRSLDLLLTSWINDGVNLWTMDQASVSLTSGTNSYTIDAKYSDFLDAVIRDSDSVDTSANRITMAEYLTYPNKATTGKPTQYAIERNSTGGHTIYVYPTPDASYTMVAWAVRYPEDVGNYDNDPDVPRRFQPAMVSGLAYMLALKNPAQAMRGDDGQMVSVNGVSEGRRQEIKQLYGMQYEAAKTEDRERASLWLVPDPTGTYN